MLGLSRASGCWRCCCCICNDALLLGRGRYLTIHLSVNLSEATCRAHGTNFVNSQLRERDDGDYCTAVRNKHMGNTQIMYSTRVIIEPHMHFNSSIIAFGSLCMFV